MKMIKKETLLQLLKERKDKAVEIYMDTPSNSQFWEYSGREDELAELIEIIENWEEI